ncbi:DUF1553 domain-containing protein [bacterium]|nr:DUF1553 domain-containing protein [bacterium]
MKMRTQLSITLILTFCAGIAFSISDSITLAEGPVKRTEFSDDDLNFFESKIRPLLVAKCGDCHGPDEQESGLRMDSWAGIVQGGKAGSLIVPGKPDSSLLIVAVNYQDNDLRMPPDGRLSKQEVADLKRWIEIGAPHPDRVNAPQSIQPRRSAQIDFEAARRFWSFRPVVRPDVPAQPATTVASDADTQTDIAAVVHGPRPTALGPETDIDRFILAKLSDKKLHLAGPADRTTLIRRLTFDLTGLPPTPEDVTTFVADDSPDAVDRLVDRLLLSPDYGQRWGRFWLDVARYADSNGLDENVAHGNAWRYRDYVIAAFNSGMPYDQFLTEQIAGDLLPVDESEPNAAAIRNQWLIATGYLALGPKVLAEPDATKMEMDIIDEQIDTLGKGVLGLTLGCSRCHDHKFDPLAQTDYYALAGVFKSTRVMENFNKVARWYENEVPMPTDVDHKAQHDAVVAEQKKRIESLVAEARETILADLPDCAEPPKDAELEKKFSQETQAQLKQERERLKELEKENAALLPTAMGAKEAEVQNVAVHLRGSHLTLGDIVPRRVPQVFQPDELREFSPKNSGRLELARWLTSRDNPLTARVMVNRIWRWHFGTGLVASTDNFGVLGEKPSHPELLDWLAAEFMDSGWSIQHIQRLILRSAVYQQASHSSEVAAAATSDPENRLLWHFPVRRLEAEAIRDSLLAVSGQLDHRMGGSMMAVDNREWVFNHLSVDPTKYDTSRRSVYLPVIRNNLYDVFQLFDYSEASAVSGNRNSSTVAPQALFMLNSDLVLDAADRLAQQALSQTEATDAERLDWLYQRILGHKPRTVEQQRLLAFVGDRSSTDDKEQLADWKALCHVLISSNEFLFVR